MAFRCKNKMLFWYTHFQKSPYRTYRGRGTAPSLHPPPLGHFTPSLCPPLTNPGYTTVTGVAKGGGVQGPSPPPPLIGETKQKWKRGSNKSFNVPKQAIWIHIISKISLPWGEGDTPPPTPSPRSVTLLPRFGPTLTNPGYTTVTLLA